MFIATRLEDAEEVLTPLPDDIVYVETGLPGRRRPGRMALKTAVPLFKRGSVTIAAYNSSDLSKASANVVCDGKDDQNVIMEAASKLSIGGRVQLLEGTFSVSAPIEINQDAVSVVGIGPGTRSDTLPEGPDAQGTRIQASPEFSTLGDGLAILRIMLPDRCVGSMQVRDLSICGNRHAFANPGFLTGLLLMSHRGFISNVTVSNCSGHGIVIRGIPGKWSTFETYLLSLISDHNGGTGVFLDAWAYDVHGLQITSHTNDGNGILVSGSSVEFGDIHTYSNALHGILFDKGTGSKVDLLKSENNKLCGLAIDSTANPIGNITISNFNVKNNSSAGDGQRSDFEIGSENGENTVGCVISIGTCFNIQSLVLPKYHFEMKTKSQNNIISGVSYSATSSRLGVYNYKGSRNIFNNTSRNGGVPGIAGAWANPGEYRDGVFVQDTTIGGKTYLGIGGIWKPLT
jgi:hypothetical protein